ncbi:MAG: phosphatase PAP2 family protein, partial [Planctomycetota bacterium]
IDRPWIYVAYHAAVALMILLTVFAWAKFGGWFWKILRHWLPIVVVVLASFREIFYLVPQVNPFKPHLPFDRVLDRIDVAIFGDVGTWLRAVLWAPAADVLSLLYWTYYPLAIVIGIVLWRRGELRAIREALTVLLVAWHVSFLGYWAVPARGPYVYEQLLGIARDAAWNGVFLAGFLHDLMITLEWEMPDAFPSGHTLVALVCAAVAWRHRALRRVATICCCGIIVATVYLRYHYIVDVLAGMALFPLCWFGGLALFRKWERGRTEEALR